MSPPQWERGGKGLHPTTICQHEASLCPHGPQTTNGTRAPLGLGGRECTHLMHPQGAPIPTCAVYFGKSYREFLAKSPYLRVEVGFHRGSEAYYFPFGDTFKVGRGHGSSEGLVGKFSNGVQKLLPKDFREDF